MCGQEDNVSQTSAYQQGPGRVAGPQGTGTPLRSKGIPPGIDIALGRPVAASSETGMLGGIGQTGDSSNSLCFAFSSAGA